MREFEVHFTSKAAGPKGHPERIVIEIGGVIWRLNRESALGWLAADDHTFYIKVGDQKVYLVAAPHGEERWLRTSADFAQPNPLLALPDFPPDHGVAR